MKFRDLIMQLSMPERIKRLNTKRHEEMTGLELLSDEELLFRYIERARRCMNIRNASFP